MCLAAVSESLAVAAECTAVEQEAGVGDVVSLSSAAALMRRAVEVKLD